MCRTLYGDNEDAVISERKLQKVFFGYCLKSLSPGYIGKKNDKLFTHLCSTTPGSSGSACVLIDRFYKEDKVYPLFIGVHMGSWTKVQVENNNYNLALAIRHPLFVKAYNEFVLPKLSESLREQFKYENVQN